MGHRAEGSVCDEEGWWAELLIGQLVCWAKIWPTSGSEILYIFHKIFFFPTFQCLRFVQTIPPLDLLNPILLPPFFFLRALPPPRLPRAAACRCCAHGCCAPLRVQHATCGACCCCAHGCCAPLRVLSLRACCACCCRAPLPAAAPARLRGSATAGAGAGEEGGDRRFFFSKNVDAS